MSLGVSHRVNGLLQKSVCNPWVASLRHAESKYARKIDLSFLAVTNTFCPRKNVPMTAARGGVILLLYIEPFELWFAWSKVIGVRDGKVGQEQMDLSLITAAAAGSACR
jgi:hypothetical protein